jgi:hypothetical protein
MTTLQLRFLHKSVPSFPMSPTSADDPGESKLKALKPRLQGSTPEKLFLCELPPSLLSSCCFAVLDAHTPIAFSLSLSLSLPVSLTTQIVFASWLCKNAVSRKIRFSPSNHWSCKSAWDNWKRSCRRLPLQFLHSWWTFCQLLHLPKATTEPIDKTPILDKTTTTVVQFLTLYLFSPQLLFPLQQLRISIQSWGLRISEVWESSGPWAAELELSGIRARVRNRYVQKRGLSGIRSRYVPREDFREYAYLAPDLYLYAPNLFVYGAFGNLRADTTRVEVPRQDFREYARIRPGTQRARSFGNTRSNTHQRPGPERRRSVIRVSVYDHVHTKRGLSGVRTRIRAGTYRARTLGNTRANTSFVPDSKVGHRCESQGILVLQKFRFVNYTHYENVPLM